jgi:uncharacterized membrane protein
MVRERTVGPLRAFVPRRSLRARLIQLIYLVVGVVLGLFVPQLQGGMQVTSREVVTLLGFAAAGLVTVGSVVFALLFLVVQFAANSQSPRLNLFRDHPLVWHTLGLVLGTLVYLLTCAIVAAGETTTTVLVPASAIALLLLVFLLCGNLQMAAFRAVQLSPVLDTVTTRTRTVIDTMYTKPYGASSPVAPPTPEDVVVVTWQDSHRVLRQIDMPKLLDLARQADVVIRLRVLPGEFVHENEAVLDIWGAAGTIDRASVLACLEVGVDRTHTQDPLLGFQLLVDIAMRAMSRINDPATAIQTMNYIESLLRTLAGRSLAIGMVTDETGAVRIIFDPLEWETFLSAGTDEIAGSTMHPMVRQRLHLMLERLADIAPPERRPPIEQRLHALDTTVQGTA